MSSYWAANHGTALVLSYAEIDKMLDKYREQNPEGTEKYELWDDIIYDFRKLVRSKYAGKTPSEGNSPKLYFQVTAVNTEETSAPTLQPYVWKGKPNVAGRFLKDGEFEPNPDYEYNRYEKDVYAIWSDKNLNSPEAFVEQPYKSYEDLKQEFKDKLASYLPDDFDWDSHIGVFDFASFA